MLKGGFIGYFYEFCSLTHPNTLAFCIFDSYILSQTDTLITRCQESAAQGKLQGQTLTATTKRFSLQGAIMHVDFECVYVSVYLWHCR